MSDRYDRYAHLHPEPVDDGHGGNIYIYAAEAIGDDGEGFSRYVAYSAPYPRGHYLASGLTVARVIRNARRNTDRRARLNAPVDVSAYTDNRRQP